MTDLNEVTDVIITDTDDSTADADGQLVEQGDKKEEGKTPTIDDIDTQLKKLTQEVPDIPEDKEGEDKSKDVETETINPPEVEDKPPADSTDIEIEQNKTETTEEEPKEEKAAAPQRRLSRFQRHSSPKYSRRIPVSHTPNRHAHSPPSWLRPPTHHQRPVTRF